MIMKLIHTKYLLTSIFLLFFVVACTISSGGYDDFSDEETPVVTDETEYVATKDGNVRFEERLPVYSFSITAEFTNTMNETVYLQRCRSDSDKPLYNVGEKKSAEKVNSAYNPVVACPAGDYAIPVEPGDTHTYVYELSAPQRYSHDEEEISGKMEGVFRLLFLAGDCPAVHDCRLDEFLYSNRFEVQIED